jgi:hypothetical protein
MKCLRQATTMYHYLEKVNPEMAERYQQDRWYSGTPEKQFASPLECSRRTGLMAARNRGYRATSGSLISSREMSPGASQSSPARYQVQTQT